MTQEVLEQKQNVPDLVPLSKWNDYFPFPSVAALRQYVFYSYRNGFDKVIRRMGKRQYICVEAFYEWVDNNTGKKAC